MVEATHGAVLFKEVARGHGHGHTDTGMGMDVEGAAIHKAVAPTPRLNLVHEDVTRHLVVERAPSLSVHEPPRP